MGEAAEKELERLRAENETYELNERSELTMLRAENEREKERADSNFKSYERVKEKYSAAEKREKALRDAAQAIDTEVKRQQRDGTLDESDDSASIDKRLLLNLRRILESPGAPE